MDQSDFQNLDMCLIVEQSVIHISDLNSNIFVFYLNGDLNGGRKAHNSEQTYHLNNGQVQVRNLKARYSDPDCIIDEYIDIFTD